MLVDLHVHTKLSSDSNVSPEQYLEAAARNSIPLGAICFTEHRLFPTDPELDRTYAELSERFGIRIFKGTEADTDLGHLLIFGVTSALMKRFDLDGRMHRGEVSIQGGELIDAFLLELAKIGRASCRERVWIPV